MQVGVRELKARLSKILARAQAGEEIEVRSHSKPIARIVGIPPAGGHLPDGLRRLAAAGGLTLGNGEKLEDFEPIPLSPGGMAVSQMVIEDRG
jgi:prevent-host-death family protein